MKSEAEVELSGELRPHVMRIEFDFQLAIPAPRVRMSRYDATLCDPGEGGAADILGAWIILMREGKAVRERKVSPRLLEKIRNDERLVSKLYEIAVEEVPRD